MTNRQKINDTASPDGPKTLKTDGIRSVGIIGLGNFGSFAAELLATDKNLQVRAYDTKHTPLSAGVERASLEDVSRSDVLILCVPLTAYKTLLPKLRPLLAAETLVVDVCSVKMEAARLLRQYLPSHHNQLITHPMFGPQSAKDGTEGQTLVITSSVGDRAQRALQYCKARLGLKIMRMTDKQHDQTMAEVHALTFFVARGLGRYKLGTPKLQVPSFQMLLDLVQFDRAHTEELFRTIQLGNPFAAQARQRLMASFAKIEAELAVADNEQAMSLGQLRKAIDDVDKELVALLDRRALLAQKAGRVKGGQIKYDPARQTEVLQNIRERNKGLFPNDAAEAVFREIISGCLSLQAPIRVSFLGPVGTYSQDAARKQFGTSAKLLPYPSLDDVLHALERSEADVAVLPIENSIEGSVNRTLDLLLETKQRIVGEVVLPIHHQLLSTAKSLVDIAEVAAHPQALAQCRVWLQKNLPRAKQIAVSSNGEAAAQAAKKSHLAAIAGKAAAQIYKLPVLANNIEDDHSNSTRFVILGDISVPPTGQDKTSLILSVANQPGSLGKLLSVLADANVNITKLESRPSPSGPWDYLFYMNIDGHAEDKHISETLNRLNERALFVKVVGSYPKADL